jgi:hypothetical protein
MRKKPRRSAEYAIWAATAYGIVMAQNHSVCVRESDQISPEMVEAGAGVLNDLMFELTDGHVTSSEVAKTVYRAMLAAGRKDR